MEIDGWFQFCYFIYLQEFLEPMLTDKRQNLFQYLTKMSSIGEKPDAHTIVFMGRRLGRCISVVGHTLTWKSIEQAENDIVMAHLGSGIFVPTVATSSCMYIYMFGYIHLHECNILGCTFMYV